MPTMDKGRPPENKRSRKPAHPVKREISQEMKNFAENTMNELLGWYGYDKVDLHDSEASDIRTHAGRVRRHHVSVLKENSDPKPCGGESKVSMGSSAPNGGREVTCCPLSPSSSSSSPHTKDLHSARAVVPIIKPSVVEEQQNVRIVCVWCQQEGLKRYCLVMGSELKSFCSEKCFAMCRRAYFKRNKAREEDRHGDKSPPSPGRTAESPSQLLPKITSSTPVCDWCKHVRHTKYLDFGAGEERLQFCSTKCLNQYKMDIFYREARAALTASSPRPTEQESNPALTAGDGHALLTPESWDSPSLEEAGRAAAAPAPTTASSAASSMSSSTRASVSAQRERESSVSSLLQSTGLPGQPVPPPRSTLVQPGPPPRPALVQPAPLPRPTLVQPAPPPHRSPVQLAPMPRPVPGQPAPPPRSTSEQPRIIPNFLRPPFHVQGVHSPAHHLPREPDSSPAQRPTHTSPHIHTPSTRPLHPQHILQPYPGPILPCPPAYPHPVPPLVPPLGLPCAQPTLLVPYPIIVPLPVPVPIPIPIPMNSGVMSQTRVIRNHEEEGERDWYGASDIPTDVAGEKSEDGDFTDHILAGRRVKTEQPLSPPDACSSVFSSHRPSAYPELYGATSLSAAQAQGPRDEGTERQVIQRVLRRLPVKQESEAEVGADLAGHRQAEGASSRSCLELNNRATAQLPARCNTDTLPVASEDSPLVHTPPLTHSLTATPSKHTSLVLWTALNHCSSDTASVVTPTVSILSNNTVASPSATQSFYSLPTASSSDRLHPSSEYRTHASQTLATPPDSEDVKENLSGGRELIFKCPGEQTDCQTDQSEESIGRAAEGDSLTADEEHTYARFIPPKLREKNTHAITHKAAAHTLSQLITHTWDKTSQMLPPAVEESSTAMDTEPALKRRCLSIRDQNK